MERFFNVVFNVHIRKDSESLNDGLNFGHNVCYISLVDLFDRYGGMAKW